MPTRFLVAALCAAGLVTSLTACGGSDDETLPQLSAASSGTR